MNIRNLIISLIIVIIAKGTDASSSASSWRPGRRLGAEGPNTVTISPQPQISPVASIVGWIDGVSNERCSTLERRRCQDTLNHVTACLLLNSSAPKQLFLLVQNDGERPLKVNVTVVNVKVTFPETPIPKLQAKKIIISENVEGSSSIIINAGNGKCIIHMESQESHGKLYKQFSAYTTHLTPIYGVYLLFLTALIVGGAWACCKLGKSERQVDRVPYQALEMGQPDSDSANNVETAEGWEQGWDDDWEETKEVKLPNGHQRGNVSANGLPSGTSDTEGQENDWND